MVIYFLVITGVGTHCCSSLRRAQLGKVVSKEKLASNACVAKEEHDSQWEGHQLSFQAPRDHFGKIGYLIGKHPTSVGLGQQQKENIG